MGRINFKKMEFEGFHSLSFGETQGAVARKKETMFGPYEGQTRGFGGGATRNFLPSPFSKSRAAAEIKPNANVLQGWRRENGTSLR